MIFNKFFKRITKQDIIHKIEIFKENNKDDFLFEEVMTDKKGKEVYLVVTYNEQYKLGKIHIFSYINEIEKVMFHTNKKDTLLIGDIQIFKNRNRGIGSKIILILESIARERKITKIKGELFSIDKSNRERQIHFYKKNGFTIVDDKLEKN